MLPLPQLGGFEDAAAHDHGIGSEPHAIHHTENNHGTTTATTTTTAIASATTQPSPPSEPEPQPTTGTAAAAAAAATATATATTTTSTTPPGNNSNKRRPSSTDGKKQRDERMAKWYDKFHKLIAFKEKYGTTHVPQAWKEDPQLANWVRVQRHKCRDKHRVQLLNDIGFVWQMKDPNSWTKMYLRLVAYKEKYGTTHVPKKWDEDQALANWVQNQRLRCKARERVDRLNEIDFVWKAQSKKDLAAWKVQTERHQLEAVAGVTKQEKV